MTDEAKPSESEPDTGATATAPDAPVEDKPEAPPKLEQQVEIKDIGPCKKHIKVTVGRPDIDKKLDEKYTELVGDGQVGVPGFRPGKAPRKIIERRFRKDVTEQVRGEVLMQSLEQLAEEHDVAPLSAPEIDPAKIVIPEAGPLVYEFDVEVRPEFDLPSYKGLKLKRPMQAFTDADVAREERRLLEPHGQVEAKPAPSGGEATVEDGDHIVADLTTRDGDKVLQETKDVKIRVQPRLIFKDGVAEKFGEQVKGAKVGEKRNVDVTLSDSVSAEVLRSKQVQINVEIKDIKIVKLPELTHELCHQFGVHSAEQLRELVRVMLDRRLEYNQRQSARRQIMEQIAATANWELPQDLLVRQARSAFSRRIMEMRSAGMSEEDINAQQRLLQQDVLQSTALALKEHFVLQKIAETEKIEINDDDMDAEIERIADQYDESPRRVRARLEKEDMMDALAAEVIERKALDLILSTAEYEDVPVGEHSGQATVEEQAVAGEMRDPTGVPPAEPKPEESEKGV